MTNYSMTNGVVNLIGTTGKIGLQGLCSEFSLPSLEFKIDDEQRLGFFAPVPVVMGMEPLEGSITVKGWSKDWQIASLNWVNGFTFQVVGSLTPFVRTLNSATTTVLFYVNAIPSKVELGTITAGENAESEIEYIASSVRISHNNVEIFNLDAASNVYVVNGVDLLKQLRESVS